MIQNNCYIEYQNKSESAKSASLIAFGIGLVGAVDFIAKWILGTDTRASVIVAGFFFTATLICYGRSYMWQNEADLVNKKIAMFDLLSKNKTQFLLMS